MNVIKHRLIALTTIIMTSTVSAANYDQRIDTVVKKLEPQVIEWRHQIHQHPELSNREFETAKLVAKHLRTLGFDQVITGIAPTGVVGILKGGKPGNRVVALRADMDALPVHENADVPFKSTRIDEQYPGGPFPVAHACGHDTHVAMLMGAASVLASMREDIPGTVMVIFQPAEEGPPQGEPFGAEAMVKAGIFNDLKPDAVFGIHTTFHPTGYIGYARGTQNSASEVITINITGMQTHGSMPFMGRDPLPVLAAINDGFAQVHRQIDSNEPLTVSIGKIDTVGRSNIIGETIIATGTVRALNQEVIEDVNKRLERIVVNAAEMHGLAATIAFDQMVPPVINKNDWVERFGPSAERVVGKDKMFDMKPSMGYDDVSVLMNKAGGGIYFLLGAQNTAFKDGQLVSAGTPGLVPNHNPGFYANDAALATGVRLHAYVAMDFLNGK